MATGPVLSLYKMELLEIIMRIMDNYPLISIALCLLIAIGLIIYEVAKHFSLGGSDNNDSDKTRVGISRHSLKLVEEQ